MFKIQGAKNDFGRGPSLSQKYNILQKRRQKTTNMTMKVHDIKKSKKNMFRELVFHGTIYLVIGEKYV